MTHDEAQILYKFFGYWQFVVCAFAFAALLSIHLHIEKNHREGKKDLGLLWLSIAIMVWSLSGLIDIVHARDLQADDTWLDAVDYQGINSVLSIVNSAFILLALPQFKHIPRYFENIVRSEGWRLTVWTTFVLSALITALMFLQVIIPAQPNFISFVDLLYAMFTLSFLGIILWSSFEHRGLKTLAYLSAVCILFTLVAQFLKLADDIFWSIFFNCVFKTVLIVLFFALALSWVEELSHTVIPHPKDMHLLLIRKHSGHTRIECTAILTIPPHIQTKGVVLTEKPFELLKLFAQRRKAGDPSHGGWLEIQPKSIPASPKFDIKDYKQISRLVDAIYHQSHPKERPFTWTKNDLKTFLFDQTRKRRIRLRINPENIDLSKA